VAGADAAGDARLAELARSGVDLAVRRAAGAATGSIVVLAERSERTFVTDRGANLLLREADVAAAVAGAAGLVHVHLSGYPLLDARSRPAGRHALALAARQGLTTSVDAASAGPLRLVGGAAFLSWVRGCHVLFANADEARALLGDAPERVGEDAAGGRGEDGARVRGGDGVPVSGEDGPQAGSENGARARGEDLAVRLALAVADGRHDPVVVVKLGPAGAAASAAGLAVSVPAVPAETVDPTGAGDAFAAGFLVSWLAGADLVGALQEGTQLGARAAATVGARPAG
jgi:ribokinase